MDSSEQQDAGTLRCPACGTVAAPLPLKDPDFVRCSGCGLLLRRRYPDARQERQSILESALAPVADRKGPDAEHVEVVGESDFLCAHIGRPLAGLRVLDVGSSVGNMLANL